MTFFDKAGCIHDAIEANEFWVLQFRYPQSEIPAAREFLLFTAGSPWLFFDEESGTDALNELRNDEYIQAEEIELRLVRYAPTKELQVMRQTVRDELTEAREAIAKFTYILERCRSRANTRPQFKEDSPLSAMGREYVEHAGNVAMQVYGYVAEEMSKALPVTMEPGQVRKVIVEPDRLAALVLLGEKAAKAALLRKKERENESHKDSGPLEYEAEGAEADLIRAAQKYFEQFPEVPEK